ncbi:MAG: phage holin family protein [Armatimonadetes bacterium]|nr:phage holin family protein [Akkermansiaceae bacterium]
MNPESNIVDLLRKLRDDTTSLVREEVVLAKTELGEKLSRTSRQVAYLAAGAFVASSALLLLLMALSFLTSQIFVERGLTPSMAYFIGFLMMAVIVGLLSYIVISKALRNLGIESITPEKTVQSLREDRQWAQDKLSS